MRRARIRLREGGQARFLPAARSRGRTDRTRPAAAAFTLVELLVVVAIIAILMSLMLPSVSDIMRRARIVNCASNMHQVHLAALAYMNDHRAYVEPYWRFANASGDWAWESGEAHRKPGQDCWGTPAKTLERRHGRKLSYLPDGRIFFCPSVLVDYETVYNPSPPGDFKTYHGTYAWVYRLVLRSEDPNPGINANYLRNVGQDAGDAVYIDSYWNRWTMNGISIRDIHFNSLMVGGNVIRHPFRTQQEINDWLWGPGKRPY